MKRTNTKEYILGQIRAKGEIKASDVARALRISRQSVAEHMRQLIASKKITRLGSTIDSRYVTYRAPGRNASISRVVLTKRVPGLREDEVFAQIETALKLKKRLSNEAYRIANYAFSEMLNNAIEHSKSKTVSAEFSLSAGNMAFWVKDSGIGVFESIRKNFKLKDHYEAVEHLMKGKQTTDPEHHSGQGIFFTSRAADLFFIESGPFKWIVDNRLQDRSLEKLKKPVYGTRVFFSIKQRSKRDLKKLFDAYTNDDFEFDKTEVFVKLSKKEGEHVSRSEARRILFGLDQFKRIVLDFEGVSGIGQAFADEVFRVFQNSHPQIKIEWVHANEAVEFMIRRALS